jgi:hypothetical protein
MSRTVKAKLGDDLRRINIEVDGGKGAQISKLVATLGSLYNIPANKTLKIRYVDEDGDFITITSDLEFKEALESSTGALRLELELINLSENHQVPLQQSELIQNDQKDGKETTPEEPQEPQEPQEGEENAKDEEIKQPQSTEVSELDLLANEFHYHRIMMTTALQSSFENIKDRYNKEYRPKVSGFLDDLQAQASSLLLAIEKTLDSLKEDFEKSTTAQKVSKKFSEGLREVGTMSEPVIERVRRSFQRLAAKLFDKKQPLNITAPEILKEMETFSSSDSTNAGLDTSLPSTPTSATPTPIQEKKQEEEDLSAGNDFVYIPDEPFKYVEQLQIIQSMGFSNEESVKTGLLIHNGDINGALDALMTTN